MTEAEVNAAFLKANARALRLLGFESRWQADEPIANCPPAVLESLLIMWSAGVEFGRQLHQEGR